VIAQHSRVSDLLIFAFDTDEVPADVSTRCESVGEIGGPWTRWTFDVTATIYGGDHLATPESFADCIHLSRHGLSLAPITCLISFNV
jgi:hypothetical protein